MLKTCTKGKLREREGIFGAAGAINIGEITFHEKPVSGGGKVLTLLGIIISQKVFPNPFLSVISLPFCQFWVNCKVETSLINVNHLNYKCFWPEGHKEHYNGVAFSDRAPSNI